MKTRSRHRDSARVIPENAAQMFVFHRVREGSFTWLGGEEQIIYAPRPSAGEATGQLALVTIVSWSWLELRLTGWLFSRQQPDGCWEVPQAEMQNWTPSSKDEQALERALQSARLLHVSSVHLPRA